MSIGQARQATASLPTLDEVRAAAELVYRLMLPTPQYRWPLLCEAVGTEVWVKHENHTPIGAFKVRGGVVHLDRLAREAEPPAGVIRASRRSAGCGWCGRSIPIWSSASPPTRSSCSPRSPLWTRSTCRSAWVPES